MTLRVDTLVTGAFVENGYVLSREGSDKVVVIDPGAEPEKWIDFLDRKGLVPTLILCTHCHLDHVGAVRALQDRYRAPFLIHYEEQIMLDALPQQYQMLDHPPIPKPKVTDHVMDDQILDHAGFKIHCIPTPGHTPGGTCYHVPELDVVFSGDTLFAGTIGRSDLPGGDHQTLISSLTDLTKRLPDTTRVLSGHGPETTIGAERTTNPFFRVDK